ncbi:MAG: TIGR00268 family protein [Candidatus Epulonipiscioides saccharophilum]|nr:MAG: TIGR00268 family protein [Epulopiscium sp. AS2M-Bin001]
MQKLIEYMSTLIDDGLVVAFSGGVDSSLLLKIATKLGQAKNIPVYAVTFETNLHPKADLAVAKKVASEVGAIHDIIFIDELTCPEILSNSKDRCYYCKRFLFETLIDYAKEHKLKCVIDGTNFDDLSQYRPGILALKELGIISPLARLEIDKATIRNYAQELNISVYDRPSAPCLATRIPYDTQLNMDVLKRIDEAENFLSDLGFIQNRVRLHNDIVRIEINPEYFDSIISNYKNIISHFKKLGFIYITLDLEGFRSGSMDIFLEIESYGSNSVKNNF